MMSRFAAKSGAIALAAALALIAACSDKKVSSIIVSPAQSSIAKGTSVAVSANAVYDDGSVTDVSTQATWSSSNESVANVAVTDASRATGLAAGTADLSAAFGGKTGATKLTITPAAVVSLAITPGVSVSLPKGTSKALAATGAFTDGTNQDVTTSSSWSSANAAVAAVVNGNLQAVGVGTTKVHADMGGQGADLDVTVTAALLSSIEVSANRASLAKGTSLPLTAKAIFGDGTVADVTSNATWSSSAAAVTVASHVAKGAAVGTASLSAAFGGKTGSMSLEVTAAEVASIAATPGTVSLAKGTSQALSVMGTFTDNSTQAVDATWTSNAPSIAVVVNGQIEARSVGSATLTATFNGKTSTVAVTATAATLSGIAIDQASFGIIAALKKPLTVTGFFTDGTAQNVNGLVTWASNNGTVATIAADGTLTANKAGQATITATSGSFSKSIAVTVAAPTLIAVEIDQAAAAKLPLGLTVQLSAVAKFDNGTIQDVSADAATAWSSANTSVATLSATGLVSASKVNKGAVRIIATFGGFGGVFDLTVTDAVVVKVEVSPTPFTLPAGLVKQFNARATFSDGSAIDPASGQVTWSTSDPKICTVSNVAGSNGLLSTAKSGKCTLTATMKGLNDTADVTVSNAALTNVTITPLQTQLKSLPLGLVQQFKATGTYTDKSTQDITAQVVWTSTADAIASISNATVDKGLASGLALGATTIKAEDPDTHLSHRVDLAVIAAVVVHLDISCTPTSLAKGHSSQCAASATFSVPGLELDLTKDVSWASSDAKRASISSTAPNDGLATTNSSSQTGSTQISANFPGRDGVLVNSNVVEISVTDAKLVSIDVVETPVTERLNHTKLNAPPFYPVTFTATGHYTDGTSKNLTTSAAWSALDPSVCSISTGGVARGFVPGICAVEATQNGVVGANQYAVLDLVLNAISVEPIRFFIPAGFSVQYRAWGEYVLQGTLIPFQFLFTDVVTWEVDPAVADVSNVAGSKGLVSTKAVGTTPVQATHLETGISNAARLDVTPALLQSLTIAPDAATIRKGLDQAFEVIGSFSDGSKQNLTSQVTCSSSDSLVATKSGNCKFHGGGVGTATISASINACPSVKSVTAKLTVIPAQLLEVKLGWCDLAGRAGGPALDGSCFDVTSAQVMVDQNTILKAFGVFTDTPAGTFVDITSSVVFDSSVIKVAQVSNDVNTLGSVTGLSLGHAMITAVELLDSSLLNGSIDLVVVPKVP
jgi:trimeric autotransporter adhesin